MKEFKMKVANDNGNSTLKMMVDDKLIISPNVYSKVRKSPNIEELKKSYIISNIEDNLIVSIQSKDINGTYLIGSYAKNSGRVVQNMQLGIFGDKTESDVYIITTLAHIAGQAVKTSKGEEREIKVSVDMAGAIPINSYTKDKANKLANKFMNEKHNIKVYLPDEVVDVAIEFELVKILPEGVPPVFYIKSTDGKYNKKRILHLNIGEGTTELPLTNDIRFNPNFIEGYDYGVGHALNRSLKEFKAKAYMTDTFSRQSFIDIVRNEEHKYHSIAMEILNPELEIESGNILRVLMEEINKANNEMDYIYVYGGGSILMKEYLEDILKSICKSINTELVYEETDVAVLSEVKGINEYLNGPIFNKIKTTMQSDPINKNQISLI